MSSPKRPYIEVLLPTTTGCIIYSLLAGIILVFQNLQVLRNFLYVSDNPDMERDAWQRINSHIASIINVSAGNTLALYLFWAFVGLIVFAILFFAMTNINELGEDLKARHYIWPRQDQHNRPLQSYLLLGLVRTLLVVVTFLYIKYVVSLLFRPITSHSVLGYILLFLFYVLLLHGLVILLRLVFMRRRLFY